MIKALVVFVLMYAGMLIFSGKRVWFSLGAAAVMIFLQIITPGQALKAINWNVIMMIAGTMALVSLFIDTKMPSMLADIMLSKAPNACWAIIILSVFSGVVSAFVDNVATVLMVAPVGIEICRKLKINPVPVIISIAVSSNLQGAATLVGDTTSILLGDYAGMNFIDFIFWQGKFSIFWAVELGALGTVFILYCFFRKHKESVDVSERTAVSDYVPGYLMILIVVLLIIASFFTIPFVDDYKNGIICIAVAVCALVRGCFREKSNRPLKIVSDEMDYETLLMLCGLFIVVQSINQAGVIKAVSDWFSSIGNGNLFVLYTAIVFISVILSAFIDNIPYVAAMLPVAQGIGENLGINPVVLYFGLLSGATLGGNITPFGASANVAGIGILKKEGYKVRNKDFFKIGIPFTFTAVLIGYLFIWFVWA